MRLSTYVIFLVVFVASSLHAQTSHAQAGQDGACRTAVLFDSVDGLFRLDEGTGTPRPVYADIGGFGSGATKPHLSPDGSTLAWVRYIPDSGTGPAIWLMDIATGNRRQLVPAINSDQPAWSADGTRIVFTSWEQRDGETIGDLYVIGADGENMQRLTDDEFRDEFATWSPDGQHIAYGSSRNGNFDIFVMRSDGTEARAITTHPATDFRSAWSPDGRWIAFSSSRHDYRNADSFKYDVYVMRADGTDVRRLTRHSLLALRPSWSPDGKKLVYQVGGAAADGSDWEIYSVGIDGGQPRRLTDNAVQDAHPDWNAYQLDCRGR